MSWFKLKFWFWSLGRPRHWIGTRVRNRYAENNQKDAMLDQYIGPGWHVDEQKRPILQEEWWAKPLWASDFERVTVSVGYYWTVVE